MQTKHVVYIYSFLCFCLFFLSSCSEEMREIIDSTSFVDAALAGDVKTIEKYIDKGIDVNAPHPDPDALGITALVAGAASEYYDVVEILLENGADVNLPDSRGYTALAVAAMVGEMEIVKLLLEYKADATIKNNEGMTALDLAKSGGYDEITALLSE